MATDTLISTTPTQRSACLAAPNLSKDRKLQLAFVRVCLEVEQEHGGQLFIDRAPHCNQWGVRVYWPHWENPDKGGVCVSESFHNLLNYELELKGEYDNPEEQLGLVKRTLIAAIARLKSGYCELLAVKARELRKQAEQAEASIADMLAENGAH